MNKIDCKHSSLRSLDTSDENPVVEEFSENCTTNATMEASLHETDNKEKQQLLSTSVPGTNAVRAIN